MTDLSTEDGEPCTDLAAVDTVSEAPAGAEAAPGGAPDGEEATPFGKPVPIDRRCTETLASGRRCGSWALRGEAKCITHVPENVRQAIIELAAERAVGPAQRLAVIRRSRFKLDTVGEVRKVLCGCVEMLLLEEIEPKQADAVGRLCRTLLDSLRNDKTSAKDRRVVDVGTKRPA